MCRHSCVTNSMLCFGSGSLARLFYKKAMAIACLRIWGIAQCKTGAFLLLCSQCTHQVPCKTSVPQKNRGIRLSTKRNSGKKPRITFQRRLCWLWNFQVEGFKLQSRNWVQSVTNDSSVPTCFSQGLVIKQLSACQVHERTSPQIGEHITVFTSVCLKNM